MKYDFTSIIDRRGKDAIAVDDVGKLPGFAPDSKLKLLMQLSDQAEIVIVISAGDIEKNKVVSALAYLGILFFLPLVAAPESKSGKFHANQSLVILLFSVAGSIVFSIP